MVAITHVEPQFLNDRLDGRYNSPKTVRVRKKIAESGIIFCIMDSLNSIG